VDDAALVDLLHADGGGVDEGDVGAVERREVLVVERRPLAAVRVVGLERLGRLRVLDDRVDPRPDLLHDPEVAVELLGHQLLG
jgi:hypothetical protein